MIQKIMKCFFKLNHKYPFIINSNIKNYLLAIGLLLIINSMGLSQCEDILVVHLKNGTDYIGQVLYDKDSDLYKIRTLDKEYFEFSSEDVDYVSTYQEVKLAPDYVKPCECSSCSIPCRKYPWYYFLELRGTGLYGKKFYYGGEGVFGIRPLPISIGIGAAALRIKEVMRIPVFLHLKYTFGENCVNPYIFGDAGVVFDKFVSDYKIKHTFKIFTEPQPKMAGIGAGIDFVISKFVDFSIDAGYRYFTLPADRIMNTCDGDKKVLGYDELHTVFFRIGLTF